MNRNHFHSIDALRFFAFLLVFFQHIPSSNNSWFSIFNRWGLNGVNFFFILSGFLISFILIREKQQNNSIGLKRFYIRRILRIVPIYYLLSIVFFILPITIINKMGLYNQFGYKPDWAYTFTFLENYKALFEHRLTSITPLSINWSLCIEEHFYLLFPLIINFFSLKRIPIVLIILFLISISVKVSAYLILHNASFNETEIITCTDLFSMGALLGYWTAARNVKPIDTPPSLKWIFVLIVIPLTFMVQGMLPQNNILSLLFPTIQGLFFTVLIAILMPQNSPIQITSKNPLSYFGKISYGMYLFHVSIINIIYLIFLMLGFRVDNSTALLGLIITSLSIVLLAAHLSYILIEKPILKLRDRYFH